LGLDWEAEALENVDNGSQLINNLIIIISTGTIATLLQFYYSYYFY